MSERKVLNKYIPPDFDPDRMAEKRKLLKKIEKRRNKDKNKTKKNLMNIRMMYPFTLQCNKCKGFTYVGTKFNSRVEKVADEHYLNIPIWKFYGRCNDCRNEIIFKTDPKNGDYVLVSGGVRTYDANKEQEVADDFFRENSIIKEEDRIENTEKQSYNALMELKRNEQLEELQSINNRNVDKIHSINKALSHLYEKSSKEINKDQFYMNNLDPEDEKAFFKLINRKRIGDDYDKGEMFKLKEDELKEEVEEEIEEEIEEDIEGEMKNDKEEVGVEMNDGVTEKNEKELPKLATARNLSENGNSLCITETDKKKLKASNCENNTYCSTVIGNNKFFSDCKNELAIKKKNLATEYNFVVKKKEDLCSMLNEYNSSDDFSES